MKKAILEIIIISFTAIALAFVYNAISPSGISIFPKSKEELQVSDSLLFGDLKTNQPTESQMLEGVGTNPIISDTTDKMISKTDTSKTQRDTTAKQDSVKQFTKNDAKLLMANAKKSKHGEYLTISYEQMLQITKKYEYFLIIDARRSEQYEKSHILHAINLFPQEDESTLIEKILSISKDKTIIIYCDGGTCELSNDLANLFDNFGYKKLFIYEGGWAEWTKKQNIKQ